MTELKQSGAIIPTVNRPPLLLRLYAFVTFPFAVEGSRVWWWRMHVDTHGIGTASAMGITVDRAPEQGCPYCPAAAAS